MVGGDDTIYRDNNVSFFPPLHLWSRRRRRIYFKQSKKSIDRWICRSIDQEETGQFVPQQQNRLRLLFLALHNAVGAIAKFPELLSTLGLVVEVAEAGLISSGQIKPTSKRERTYSNFSALLMLCIGPTMQVAVPQAVLQLVFSAARNQSVFPPFKGKVTELMS
mmetsp:Transcript_12331/g.29625  ORF Transcript_12331/g.29625 Transcript_12331/m.29625 type:complete len:164 (-) Transcript_12331:1627-2118(-)